MNVKEFKKLLNLNPNHTLEIILPNQKVIPAHFHITEVARIQKDFIDCGGTVRTSTTCLLQTWVANDKEHRLISSKLEKIFDISESILKSDQLDIEIEYEDIYISQFPINHTEATNDKIIILLGTKHTDCLAKDKCGVEESNSCCSGGSCC